MRRRGAGRDAGCVERELDRAALDQARGCLEKGPHRLLARETGSSEGSGGEEQGQGPLPWLVQSDCRVVCFRKRTPISIRAGPVSLTSQRHWRTATAVGVWYGAGQAEVTTS